MRLRKMVAIGVLSVALSLIFPSRARVVLGQQPSEDRLLNWSTVEAHDNGVPVYAFGYTYVYGVSPDFLPGVVLQEGNKAPGQKIRPKKSWEIKNNLFGSTPAREPRTAANDDQPLLGVHLIDGDVRSCWASRGQNTADFEPVWIRIDLPMEALIGRVVLVGHPEGMGRSDPKGDTVKVGQAYPRKLEIRLSRDAGQWKTVYETNAYTPQDVAGRNEIPFRLQLAKQIWIIGSDLPPVHYFMHSFSVAGVEVLDGSGKNVALIDRGAGVQVSSTHSGYGMDRFTQDNLWPTQYDLGFKWTRVGYDMSWFQWQYVEREKGKLKVDERTEAALTEAVNNGLNVVMVLDKGNWLYTSPPRMLDRTRDLMETYSSAPPHAQTGIGWQNVLISEPAVFEGYLNYIRFMVRRFKDRVKIFEVWNEWYPYTSEQAKRYAPVLRAAIKVIREEYPQAKIMPASPGGLEEGLPEFFKVLGEEGLLSQVDVIGFHPAYDPPASPPHLLGFPRTFARFKKNMEGYGFKGDYMATEYAYTAPYPVSRDTPEYWHSELQKAIYAARLSITFANLGIVGFWNETFQTMQTYWALSLFRNNFSNEVICPTQPETVYYVLRTLSTALEDVKGADLPVTFDDKRADDLEMQHLVQQFGFVRSNGEKLVAFWLLGVAEGRAGNATALITDILIKGVKGQGATIIDVLNGTEKPLNVEPASDGIAIRKIRVENWPLIVRLPN